MQYKILLVGDGNSGKTTFLTKYFSNYMETRYIATLGCEVSPIKYNDNIQFSIWDCAGQEHFGGLKDRYYLSSDAAIVFYDTSSELSKNHVPQWINSIRNIRPDIPIILCGTKSEIGGLKYQYPVNNKSCIISTMTGHNMNMPFDLVVDALTQNVVNHN